jgi:hypothetical protein
LITGDTLKNLPVGVAVRRLARVQAVNIAHAVDLYEIVARAPSDWEERCTRYGEALLALEQENWDEAASRAARLAVDFPLDAAVAALVQRVNSPDRCGQAGDTAVWQLPGK